MADCGEQMQTAMQPLDWQVQQARRIPIPSHQEQLLLGRAIRAWQDHPDGPDAAPALVQKRGRRALDRLVSGNLRLVARLVVRGRASSTAIDNDDLMQLGSEGLIKAALKFKPELGYSFTTYAMWWVRQALQRSKRERYLIPLPHQMVSTIDRARQELARMPAPDLDAAASACSTATHTVTRAELERAFSMASMASACSLDAPVTDDMSPLSTLVADVNTTSPWEQLERDIDADRLALALEALEPKERRMVEEVVVGGSSFQAVAERLGVHRESVRKAHGKALNKLRRSLMRTRAA